MDTVSFIEQNWRAPSKTVETAALWDAMAERFGAFTMPSISKSSILKLLLSEELLEGERLLDIGCGAGKYSLSLSNGFKSVTGIDISPKMLEFASDKAKELNIKNVEFVCQSWEDINLLDLKFQNAFDLVLAHMTPAINSLNAFKNMINASRKACVFTRGIRRTDSISDPLTKLFDPLFDPQKKDLDALYAINYLFMKGYEPRLFYSPDEWENEMSIEKAFELYIKRLEIRFTLSNDDKQKIRKYLEGISENGTVKERTKTTVLTIIWNV